MIWKRRFAICLTLLLPFADACTELKRLAYEDMGRRDEWQSPEQVIESLGLSNGQRIADLGAGGGYFTFRLAEAVAPDGVVYAIDVDEGMLERLERVAEDEGVGNVKTVMAREDDPGLPEAVDLVFISNTYHHLQDRIAYFQRLQRSLKPGGRVAVLEYGVDDGMFSSCAHGTKADRIRTEMEASGYTLSEQFDFTSRQSFQIFRVASTAP